MTAHISVRSSFDYSETLREHIERRVTAALRAHAAQVEDIVLRLSDANGPRGGANDKVVRISINVKPSGRIDASAASSDIYASVDRASGRLRAALQHHRSRLKSRPRKAADRLRRDAN